MFSFKTKKTSSSGIISVIAVLAFFVNLILPAQGFAQALNLPAAGTMLALTPGFSPVMMIGMEIFPENPFKFDFIINNKDNNIQREDLKIESERMIKYFLASMTIPEQDLWVNLSPYEQDRIIPEALAQTDLGRDLLAQDYVLKQFMASLIHPENDLGKQFWKRVYQKVYELYGTTQIPIDTFNKVWIMPGRASVYRHKNMIFVSQASLKVMLEEDYVALEKSDKLQALSSKQNQKILNTENLQLTTSNDFSTASHISASILREIVIPELEKEVNASQSFATLRQAYHALILGTWFKTNLKEGLLGRKYVNQSTIEGIDLDDKNVKQKIYEAYLSAYQQGVYNFIRTEYDERASRHVPRRYFSGGFVVGHELARKMTEDSTPSSELGEKISSGFNTRVQAALLHEKHGGISPSLRGMHKGEIIIAPQQQILDYIIAAYPDERGPIVRAQLSGLERTTQGPSKDLSSEEAWNRMIDNSREEVLSIKINFESPSGERSVVVQPQFSGLYASWKVIEVFGLEQSPEISSFDYNTSYLERLERLSQSFHGRENLFGIMQRVHGHFGLSDDLTIFFLSGETLKPYEVQEESLADVVERIRFEYSWGRFDVVRPQGQTQQDLWPLENAMVSSSPISSMPKVFSSKLLPEQVYIEIEQRLGKKNIKKFQIQLTKVIVHANARTGIRKLQVTRNQENWEVVASSSVVSLSQIGKEDIIDSLVALMESPRFARDRLRLYSMGFDPDGRVILDAPMAKDFEDEISTGIIESVLGYSLSLSDLYQKSQKIFETGYEGAYQEAMIRFDEQNESEDVLPVGGIDFANLYEDLDIHIDSIHDSLFFQPEDFERIQIDSLSPIIIQMTPINNLSLLLGYNMQEENIEGQTADMLVDDKRQMSLLN